VTVALTRGQECRIARRLYEAEASGQSIAPPSGEFTGMTFEDAYAVQSEIAALKEARGMQQLGWKLAFTSPAMQECYGFTESGRGYLFQGALAEGEVHARPGQSMLTEPEVSFVLASDLTGPDVSAADVLAATQEVCASIEVASLRYIAPAPPVDMLADNAGAAYLVLSPRRFRVEDTGELSEIAVEFLKNGELVHSGSAKDVLGSPVNAVAWLANH
jgi:2-keto-4-pentenoate hydratase